jgi:putative ABC transport system ATP-binding protein
MQRAKAQMTESSPTTHPSPVIALEQVSRVHGHGAAAVHAVRDVSLEVFTGSLVTIVGASGSGKSTLLNMMGTLDRPTQGTVRIDGLDVFSLDDDERSRLRRERIGFVFQFFHLLPTLTAVENVMLTAELAGRGGKQAKERALSLLDRVGLSGRAKHRPDELSGGEMQRVAIARALMMDPKLLLADEPTGNLDSKTGRTILDLLRGAADENRTVVLVTHDPLVAKQGDRVLTMADGLLAADVTGADFHPSAFPPAP